MKHFILTTLLLISALSLLNAQQISSESYNKDLIHEDFNQEGDHFKIVTTTDNYFILDKGDYLLSRNNDDSEYAIIAKNSTVSDFVLKTALRLGPSDNKRASIGIILKAQPDGKGATIFEINKKGEYRIKQLIGNSYQSLSGKSKQAGWVKSKLINGVDEHNFIEIRSENNIYDVYTNSEYLTTFFIPDFTAGSCGLIISPETKARISYYYINIKGENNIVADYTNKNSESVNATIEKLNKEIELLKENNAKLNELNSDTKGLQADEITGLNKTNENLKTTITELEQKITELNSRNTTLSSEIDNLKDQQSNLKTKNSDLTSISIQQKKEISSLNNTIDNIKNTSDDATANNKKLNKKIASLKQQISLDKVINTELTNDLKEVKTLKTEIKKLKTSNATLSANLSKEKKSHQQTKNGLSTSVKNKTAKIKECTSNSAHLSAELSKANKGLEILRNTQNKHDAVTSDLNNQITDMQKQIDALQKNQDLSNAELSALNKTNTELKELFIQKDFELNGVKPSEMIKQTSNTPTSPKILKGNKTIYTVQFGVFMQEQSYKSTKQLDNVWYNTTEYGTYVYYSGEFNSPQDAASHQNDLIAKGYNNSFVVTLSK